MKAPWVNPLLLIILLVQVVTGYLGMVNNQRPFSWVLWTHGIGAYAIILLLYWKGAVIFDAIRRKNVWTRQRILFLITLFFLFLTLLPGLIWTFVGPRYFLGISYISWHIYAAIPLMGLMVWHAWKMRFILRFPEARGRSLFIKTAVFSLAGALLWGVGRLGQSGLNLPGSVRRFTGSYPRGLEDGRFPVVSWINDNPAPVDVANWRLTIRGAVAQTAVYQYDQLLARPQQPVEATLDCTGGWYTIQSWRGISLGALLNEADLLETAESITVRSITGYQRRFSLAEANRYLLAIEVRNEPLSHGHGFPLRLVAPDKRGVAWVKWVTHIEVNTTSKIWQSPLPLQ